MKCNVPKCRNRAVTRGLCHKHYFRVTKKNRVGHEEAVKYLLPVSRKRLPVMLGEYIPCLCCDKPGLYFGLCKRCLNLVHSGDRESEEVKQILSKIPDDLLKQISDMDNINFKNLVDTI